MTALRAFLQHHRKLAALLVALTLCMKALVPAGYMVDGGPKVFTVHICADSLGQVITKTIVIPQSGHGDANKAHADSPCHFTALGHAALGGADPIQLALALLFILAVGLLPLVFAPPAPVSHLRSPLRGPPLPA